MNLKLTSGLAGLVATDWAARLLAARLNERGLRDIDHRFEWTRSEFEAWARELADQFAYKVRASQFSLSTPR